MIIETIKKKGRKPETDKTKIEREQLKAMFEKHAPSAMKTVVSIMQNSLDSSVRLKASTYILDKLTPKTYEEDEIQEFSQSISINLVPVRNKTSVDYEEVEEQIRRIEEGERSDSFSEWETEEDEMEEETWGSEVYDPKTVID